MGTCPSSERIQKYVEDEQYKSRRYQQNLFPAARVIPIARGEVIGKSGQTGAGPPHLHFEIRSKNNQPLNPLAFFDKKDAIKPSVYTVTVTPIQPDDLETPPSTVDGMLLPKSFTVGRGRHDVASHYGHCWSFRFLPTITSMRRVGLCRPIRHRLIVNGDQYRRG